MIAEKALPTLYKTAGQNSPFFWVVEMEGKQRGEPREETFWEDLKKAMSREERRKAVYGLRAHRSLRKSIFLLLEAAGIEPTHKIVEDLIDCVYLRTGLIRDSRHWKAGFGTEKEYETIDYVGREGIRLSQSSTNEAVVSRRLAAPPYAAQPANSISATPCINPLPSVLCPPYLYIWQAQYYLVYSDHTRDFNMIKPTTQSMRAAHELTKAFRTISNLNKRIKALEAENTSLRRHAHEDALTGLGNKRAFLIEFEGAMHAYRRDYPGAVPFSLVIIDANGLKIINDSLGHSAGDALIKTIAEGITSTTRAGKDFAARIGGDEFAVLLKGPADAFSMRIHKVLEATGAGKGLGFPVSVSIGHVSVAELDAEKKLVSAGPELYEAMFKIADARMYEQKMKSKSGRDAAAITNAIRT